MFRQRRYFIFSDALRACRYADITYAAFRFLLILLFAIITPPFCCCCFRHTLLRCCFMLRR